MSYMETLAMICWTRTILYRCTKSQLNNKKLLGLMSLDLSHNRFIPCCCSERSEVTLSIVQSLGVYIVGGERADLVKFLWKKKISNFLLFFFFKLQSLHIFVASVVRNYKMQVTKFYHKNCRIWLQIFAHNDYSSTFK